MQKNGKNHAYRHGLEHAKLSICKDLNSLKMNKVFFLRQYRLFSEQMNVGHSILKYTYNIYCRHLTIFCRYKYPCSYTCLTRCFFAIKGILFCVPFPLATNVYPQVSQVQQFETNTNTTYYQPNSCVWSRFSVLCNSFEVLRIRCRINICLWPIENTSDCGNTAVMLYCWQRPVVSKFRIPRCWRVKQVSTSCNVIQLRNITFVLNTGNNLCPYDWQSYLISQIMSTAQSCISQRSAFFNYLNFYTLNHLGFCPALRICSPPEKNSCGLVSTEQ